MLSAYYICSISLHALETNFIIEANTMNTFQQIPAKFHTCFIFMNVSRTPVHLFHSIKSEEGPASDDEMTLNSMQKKRYLLLSIEHFRIQEMLSIALTLIFDLGPSISTGSELRYT